MNLDWLGAGDLDAALALSTAEGWNQTAADWRRLLRLDASGCFAAREADRLIGTVTTTTYGRELAWIGMMLVHPDHRGRGVGRSLMRMTLEYLQALGLTSIKLDATPAGRPLYESLGFVAEAEFERWQGVAHSQSRPALPDSGVEALPAMVALDQAAYGVGRSPLLEMLASESLGDPLLVRSDAGSPEGYALARAGRVASYIGPLVATTAEGAAHLMNGMLGRLAGLEVCLDLHVGGLLEPKLLAEAGLSKRRSLTRMRLGARSRGETATSVCASAGPELG